MATTARRPRLTGADDQIVVVRRAPRQPKSINVDISNQERVFLLHGLASVASAIDYVLRHPGQDHTANRWQRDLVQQSVLRLRETLASGALAFVVITPVHRSVLQYAIEENPYFTQMRDDDYRLTPQQVKAANDLRVRVAALIGRNIRPVRLGPGREQLAEIVS